jgi:hypothetical protein
VGVDASAPADELTLSSCPGLSGERKISLEMFDILNLAVPYFGLIFSLGLMWLFGAFA